MKPIPLFGTGIQALSASLTAQRRVNCYYEIREDQDKATIVIRGTPGLTFAFSVPSAPIRGWRSIGSTLYVVAGLFLYSVSTTGTVNTLGTLSTASGYVSLSNNATQLIIVDGGNGYIYTFSGGTFVKITDANFPSNPQFVAFLQGRFLVNQANTTSWYVSVSGDGTNWSTPIVLVYNKQDHPDVMIALDVLHDNIILWGDTSIEFWQNVGTYPGPYQRIPGATQDWGLAAPYSRAYFNNSYAFLAKNTQGQVQIMVLNGVVPNRISTSDIEHIIDDIAEYSIISDAVAFSYISDGHLMYQLTFPTAGRSILYDGLTNMWTEVQSGLSPTFARHVANLGVVFNNQNYVSDATTGNIYLLDRDSYTDNGATIRRQVRSRRVGGTGDITQISSLYLDMQVGAGLQTGQGSNPQVMLEVSRDGGYTFDSPRVANIGAAGQYTARAVWNRIGQDKGPGFVFQFTMTDPVPFLINLGAANQEPTLPR